MTEGRADNPTPGADMPKSPAPKAPVGAPSRVVIWAWPKTIVFWPTCICAMVFGIITMYSDAKQPLKRIADAAKAYVKKVDVIQVEGGGATTTPAAAAQENAPTDPAALRSTIQEVGRIAIDAIEDQGDSLAKWLGLVFLCVFTFNMIAFSFDIEVKGLAIAVLAVSVVVFASLFFSAQFDFFGFVQDFVRYITPIATASFYFVIGGVILGVLFIAMVSTYLHRVDVTHNEVRVRTGLMEAERRISTNRLTFTKDITDLMEHWFLFFGMFSRKLGCGRLVFSHPQLDTPIVLDNVIGVEHKADVLGKILGVMAVKDND